jgi:transposase, IS30 family
MPGKRLRFEDREAIERGLQVELSHEAIAAVIGVVATTVAREVAREGARDADGEYRAELAQQAATELARRPKLAKLVGRLAAIVSGLLGADWSPQQIAAMLPRLYPTEPELRVSHETIYQSLFVQGRGELNRELVAHLRTARTARKPRGRIERRGKLVGMVPIRERPAEAADRAVPGHWEGDLILGGQSKGAVISLVERRSRFTLFAPLPKKRDKIETRAVLTELISRLPAALQQSLTWDQGKEMAEHAQFTIDTGLQVYFCDPHSPWQRPTNENTNGLARQYWPKGADLRALTWEECDAVALRLNTRPRAVLGWQTPAQVLEQGLTATTG